MECGTRSLGRGLEEARALEHASVTGCRGGEGRGAREMRMGQLRQRGVIGKLETGHVDCLYSRRVIALHNLAGP